MDLLRKNWFVGLCCLGMMVAVAGAMGWDFVEAVRSRFWRETPCRILESHVAQEPFSRKVMHFVLKVEFSYSFEGREYRSSRYSTGQHPGSTDVQVAERAAVRYPAGAQATCYVNPRQPGEAVLVRGQIWGAIMLLGPLVILGLMTHESIFAWFEQRRRRVHVEHGLPFSDGNEAVQTDGRMVLFALLGLVVGVFFLGFCIGAPLRHWWQARQWVEREAYISRCQLHSRSGTHGPEYSLDLLYEYEFAGRQLHSSRQSFATGVDEPVADLSDWIAAHPVGSRVKCRVNPVDPTEAVLENHLRLGWVSLALGLLMLGFGLYCIGQLWSAWRWRRLSGKALEAVCLSRAHRHPLQFRVRPPPWLVALGAFLAAPPLLAAGAWSLQKGIRALLQGRGDIINLLYGAGAVVIAGYCVVAGWKYLQRAFRPRPVLQLRPGTPRVGESFELEWKLPKAGGSVSWLRLWLEGAEQAKVRQLIAGHQGSVSEEKLWQEVFASHLLTQSEASGCESGRVCGVVPAEAMHSFRGAKCGVVWYLRAEFGRDQLKMEYKFPIHVLPAQP